MDMQIITELVELENLLAKTMNGFCRSVAIMAEMEMMKANNEERRSKGLVDAYGHDAFAVLVQTQENIVADMQ